VKIRYVLGAGVLCLAALASVWVVVDPEMQIQLPHDKINASLAEDLPRQEVVSGAEITIVDIVLSTGAPGRINVAAAADVELNGMAGRVDLTISGTPKYQNAQVFFSDPVIEALEYEFPDLNISSRREAAGAAGGLVTYMLPSLTKAAVARLQSTPLVDLSQNSWKQRAARTVLSDLGVTDTGLVLALHPARLLPHVLFNKNTLALLVILCLFGVFCFELRSSVETPKRNGKPVPK